MHAQGMGPLTPKFDTATWPFLKIDMRHGSIFIRHEKNNNSEVGHGDFLNSTCDNGDPRQGPQV